MKKNTLVKGICAIAMGAALMFGTVPAIAHADGESHTTYYGDLGPAINTCSVDYERIQSSMKFDQDYKFDKRVLLEGGVVNFDIAQGVTVDAPYGITVAKDAKFFVTGGGTLRVDGLLFGGSQWNGYAGIGGDPYFDETGRIEIVEGTVYAEGGPYAAGIGGTFNYDAGTIIIDSCANVTARGGFEAAGIGGGWNGTANSVDIKGTVNADGGNQTLTYSQNGENVVIKNQAPAIGSGNFYSKTGDMVCFTVILEEGSKITAKTPDEQGYAQAIGAGHNVEYGFVTTCTNDVNYR